VARHAPDEVTDAIASARTLATSKTRLLPQRAVVFWRTSSVDFAGGIRTPFPSASCRCARWCAESQPRGDRRLRSAHEPHLL